MATHAVAITSVNDTSILFIFRAEIRTQANGASETIRNAAVTRCVQCVPSSIFGLVMCTGEIVFFVFI